MIMKNNVIEYITDSFIDYKGEEHKIVVCAISSTPESIDDGYGKLAVANVCEEYCYSDTTQYIERMVSIGYSVCNPEDTFNEDKGKLIAFHKALNNFSKPVLCSPVKGVVNKILIKALLKQEIKFVKENPEKVIKGYDDSKARYERKKKTLEEYNSLSEEEKNLVDKVLKGENLEKYSNLANRLKNYNDQK